MILKLYRDDTGYWSFNYKQQHYLVLTVDWVLDKLCNLLDKNVTHINVKSDLLKAIFKNKICSFLRK